MRRGALRAAKIEFQPAVSGGSMVGLEDVVDGEARVALERQPEANGVAGALLGKTWAAGVAKVAAVLEFVFAGVLTFVAGSAALATPQVAERETHGMRPQLSLESLGGDEEGAGHGGTLYSG